MKSKRIISSAVVLVTVGIHVAIQFGTNPSTASASSIDWKTFDVARELSRKHGKPILLDVYTNWCTWCKKMDKEVYADSAISAIIRSNFIAVKLNAESGTNLIYEGKQISEAQFAQFLGIRGYPTTVFFGTDGKPITIVPGFIPANDFSHILQFIGEGHYQKMSFEMFLGNRGKR